MILHCSHWVAARIHISHVIFAPAENITLHYSDFILSKHINYIEYAVLLQVCIIEREFFFSLTDFLWSSNTSAGISGVPVKQFEDRSVRRKQIVKTSCWHLAVCWLRRGGLRISWHSVSLQSQSVFWKQTNSQNNRNGREAVQWHQQRTVGGLDSPNVHAHRIYWRADIIGSPCMRKRARLATAKHELSDLVSGYN